MKALLVGLIFAVSISAQAESKRQVRCGYYNYGGPDNVLLTDKDGVWIVYRSFFQARGQILHNAPEREKVYSSFSKTYNYFCGCVNGQFDLDLNYVEQIYSITAKPLSACLNDSALDSSYVPRRQVTVRAPRLACNDSEQQVNFRGFEVCVKENGDYIRLVQ